MAGEHQLSTPPDSAGAHSSRSDARPEQPVVIEVTGLRKRYARGNTEAVRGVDFRVHRGEIFGLIGPDGAGKTSVLQILAGVLRCESGSAAITGVDVSRQPERVKPMIGYMPQGLGLILYDKLTVWENVQFFRELRQLEKARFQANFERLLAMTRLSPFLQRPAGKLSGGMRQKLALICTLIHLPDILLLDEPTTGVDPLSRRDFWNIIHQLVQENRVTVLLTTSYMDEAERCHRVALMHQGALLTQGEPSALTRASRQENGAVSHPGQTGEDVTDPPSRGGTALEVLFARLVNEQDQPGSSAIRVPIVRVSQLADPVFDLRGISKQFGDFVAVDQVELTIGRGEIFGLLGPNGAGKTTLIKMLCCLLPPSSGAAWVGGFQIPGDNRRLRHHIGYMSQRFSLYRDISVAANLSLFGRLHGLRKAQIRSRADELLTHLQLNQQRTRLAGTLPLGMQQRLALACALIHQPEILFLDEPTAGVDPMARRRFWSIVHDLASQARITVLVSTHYMDEAENCDRLGFMNRGGLIAADTTASLKQQAERHAGPVLVVDSEAYEQAYPLLRDRFPAALLYGRLIQWQTRDPEGDGRQARELLLSAGVTARTTCRSPNIEESFVYFIQREDASHAGS